MKPVRSIFRRLTALLDSLSPSVVAYRALAGAFDDAATKIRQGSKSRRAA